MHRAVSRTLVLWRPVLCKTNTWLLDHTIHAGVPKERWVETRSACFCGRKRSGEDGITVFGGRITVRATSFRSGSCLLPLVAAPLRFLVLGCSERRVESKFTLDLVDGERSIGFRDVVDSWCSAGYGEARGFGGGIDVKRHSVWRSLRPSALTIKLSVTEHQSDEAVRLRHRLL